LVKRVLNLVKIMHFVRSSLAKVYSQAKQTNELLSGSFYHEKMILQNMLDVIIMVDFDTCFYEKYFPFFVKKMA
jgi:hypothetical protein